MTTMTGTKLLKTKKYTPLYLMMLPGMVYLLINNYFPMLGLIIAFKKIDYSNGLFESLFSEKNWIGFDNFNYLFRTPNAYLITRNTVLYNIAFIILNTIVALAIAILLKEIKNKFLNRFYQSIIIFPNLISMVIVGYLVMAFLNTESGFFNKAILPLFGINPLRWYDEPRFWPFIIPLVNMWKNVGLLSIIYFSSIISIDEQYYEAAVLDGASKWRQIRSITIPQILPVIIMMILLSIGRMFYSDFGLFYQVPSNSSSLYNVTTTLDVYVFRTFMRMGNIGMASAAGFYQSIIGFILVLISNLVVRKYSRENALF